jgi:hypothetical protein
MQITLIDAESKEASIGHANAIARALECLFHIREQDASRVTATLRAQILNTVERSRAYLTFNEQLSGQVFSGNPPHLRKNSCTFDPDVLPN